MPKIFLLPLEVFARDFEYKLVLANFLAKPDHFILIAHHDIIRSLVNKCKYSCNYVGKNIFRDAPPHDMTQYKNLKESGGALFYLHDEGMFKGTSKDWKSSMNLITDSTALEESDYLYLWSEFQDEHYRALSTKATILVTGHPRFNLYNLPYKNIFPKSQVSDKAELAANNLLFASNYGVVNSAFGMINLLKNSNMPSDSRASLVSSEFYGLFRFLDAINIALETTSGIISIRPHPGEDNNFYSTIYANNPRVKIVSEGSLAEHILKATLVVQSGNCTSGLEAFMAGIPVISLSSQGQGKEAHLSPYDYSMVAEDNEKFAHYLRQILSFSTSSPGNQLLSKKAKIAHNFSASCNNDGFKLLSSSILESSVSIHADNIKKCLSEFNYVSHRYAFERLVKRFIKNTTGFKKNHQKYADTQFPKLSLDSVKSTLSGINNTLNTNSHPLSIISHTPYSLVLAKAKTSND